MMAVLLKKLEPQELVARRKVGSFGKNEPRLIIRLCGPDIRLGEVFEILEIVEF